MDKKVNITRGGLASTLALGLAVLALVVSLFGNAATYKIARDSGDDSARTFHALCDLKGDLRDRRDRTIDFLQLSEEEQIAQFGKALADVPDATFLEQIRNQNQTLASLSTLDC